ncbi:MAG: hypothetical protein R6U50_08800 [Desulfobacterales bacterium]
MSGSVSVSKFEKEKNDPDPDPDFDEKRTQNLKCTAKPLKGLK